MPELDIGPTNFAKQGEARRGPSGGRPRRPRPARANTSLAKLLPARVRGGRLHGARQRQLPPRSSSAASIESTARRLAGLSSTVVFAHGAGSRAPVGRGSRGGGAAGTGRVSRGDRSGRQMMTSADDRPRTAAVGDGNLMRGPALHPFSTLYYAISSNTLSSYSKPGQQVHLMHGISNPERGGKALPP